MSVSISRHESIRVINATSCLIASTPGSEQSCHAAQADVVLLSKLPARRTSLEPLHNGLHIGLVQPVSQTPYVALAVRGTDARHRRRVRSPRLCELRSRHLQVTQEVWPVGVTGQ